MSLYWTAEELFETTGYRRQSLQKAALAELGIRFKSRPRDGFPLVERTQAPPSGRKRGPDFEAVAKAG